MVILASFVFSLSVRAALPELRSEKTKLLETGRYEETIRFCQLFQKEYPRLAKCVVIGKTAQNRDIVALQVSKNKANPWVWIQAGIHAGEIEGKDAGFLFLKKALSSPSRQNIFEKISLFFLPVINPDGHERFSPNHRANQNGPKEMGFRVNALNQNLNRDYLKLESNEVRAAVSKMNQLDPLLVVDIHVTDGAQFQHDVATLVYPTQEESNPLNAEGKVLEKTLITELTNEEYVPVHFYPEFRETDNPLSGFEHTPVGPRFTYGYWSARGRLGVLIENHSWRDYPYRVKLTEKTIEILLKAASKKATLWKDIIQKGDENRVTETLTERVLSWKNSTKSRIIDFLGYHFEKKPSVITEGTRIVYSPEKKEVWKTPLFDEIEAELKVQSPRKGYFLPKEFRSRVEPLLKMHGISFSPLKEIEKREFSIFHFNKTEFSKESQEGHITVKSEGEWKKEMRAIEAGDLFIPIHQKNRDLVLNLFEPEASDSLVHWGTFNSFLEQKEYVEDYVLESFAEDLLKNPKIKEEFELKLKDEAFQKSSAERKKFFYEKHPIRDERYRVYPVLKE